MGPQHLLPPTWAAFGGRVAGWVFALGGRVGSVGSLGHQGCWGQWHSCLPLGAQQIGHRLGGVSITSLRGRCMLSGVAWLSPCTSLILLVQVSHR